MQWPYQITKVILYITPLYPLALTFILHPLPQYLMSSLGCGRDIMLKAIIILRILTTLYLQINQFPQLEVSVIDI